SPPLGTPAKYGSKPNASSRLTQLPRDAQIVNLDDGPRHRSAPSSPAANHDDLSLPEASNDMLVDGDVRAGRPTSSIRSRYAAQSAPAKNRSLTAPAPAPNLLHGSEDDLPTPCTYAPVDTSKDHASTEMVAPPEYPIDEPFQNFRASSSPARRPHGEVRPPSPDSGIPRSQFVSGKKRSRYGGVWPEES
ncbi:hypothetical protein LTS18_014674, partial [Coniosporium uncinatum]